MVIFIFLTFYFGLTSDIRPSIPPNVQNMFLVTLLASLENTVTVKRVTRKTAKAADSVQGTDKMIESSKGANSSPYPVTENPALPSDFITIGINQVTRRLESQVKSFRKLVTLATASSVNQISSELASIAVVLVCRADVNPPVLLDHIPHLVAACNSTRPRSDLEGARQPLKLILLPKGSESAIAQALGLRRAAVIAIHVSIPNLCRILISDAPLIRIMLHIYLHLTKCFNLCLSSVRHGLYLQYSPLLREP